MRSRGEVATFINEQLHGGRRTSRSKNGKCPYGRQELKDLLDYIYLCSPEDETECITYPEEQKEL